MSAPTLWVDETGFCVWTQVENPPDHWMIEQCLEGGQKLYFYSQTIRLDGSTTSFDAATAYLYKGLHLCLYGVDSGDNIVLLPSISNNPLNY